MPTDWMKRIPGISQEILQQGHSKGYESDVYPGSPEDVQEKADLSRKGALLRKKMNDDAAAEKAQEDVMGAMKRVQEAVKKRGAKKLPRDPESI